MWEEVKKQETRNIIVADAGFSSSTRITLFGLSSVSAPRADDVYVSYSQLLPTCRYHRTTELTVV